MLPPFIIEQIRRREDEEQPELPQPLVELPHPSPLPPREQQPAGEEPHGTEDPERGVVIIDLVTH